jgi:hypothetical protein
MIEFIEQILHNSLGTEWKYYQYEIIDGFQIIFDRDGNQTHLIIQNGYRNKNGERVLWSTPNIGSEQEATKWFHENLHYFIHDIFDYVFS